MPAVPDSTPTPNSVTSAAEMLQKFVITSPKPPSSLPEALIAAQLLAIATQFERGNVALERSALAVETIARQEMNQ